MCLEVPWFFTLLAALVWFVGLVCFVNLVLGLVVLALRGLWLVVYFLLECVGAVGFWVLGLIGRGFGMGGEGEVPVVVVVDTEE